MNEKGVTLTRFITGRQGSSEKELEFCMIMSQLALVGKVIAREVGRAGLAGILGLTGKTNIQGEAVRKLDHFANETFIELFGSADLIRTLVSEEMEGPLILPRKGHKGRYALLFDPLDGSSNIDVNGSLGTFFSLYETEDSEPFDASRETLRKGIDQVAGGYILYGPSTILVYSSGNGTHGFTLDPHVGEYFLTHENIRIPRRGRIYSVNQGNYHDWFEGTRRYIDYLQQREPKDGRPYSLRYSGTLVADLHRTLLDGGIFLYPAGKKNPEGKLRLLYEAAPAAFVVENAGGMATQGCDRILQIAPSGLHQRVPLVIGSPDDVEKAAEFICKK